MSSDDEDIYNNISLPLAEINIEKPAESLIKKPYVKSAISSVYLLLEN